jgi:hypothetical protein
LGIACIGGFQQDVEDLAATHAAKCIGFSSKGYRNVSMAQAQSAKVADNGRRKGVFCARFWQFIPIPDLVK